jgi:pimeloyl-ACP methyl ester carboxylesterase
VNKVRLQESPISFQVIGDGPPLVLLHGFGGSHTHWDKITPELSKNFKVISPNLGPLTLGSMKLTFSEQVEMMGDFKRAIFHEFGKFSVCGISYGAATAWAMAAHDDEAHIEKILLINPMPPNPVRNMASWSLKRLLFMGRWTPLLALYLLTPLAHWDFHQVAGDIRVDWPTRAPRFAKIFSRRQKMLFHLIHRFAWIVYAENWKPWWNELKKIKIPISIVHGSHDRIFSDATMKKFRSNLMDSEMHTIERGTHLAIQSSSREIIALIKEFLKIPKAS